MKKVYIEIPEEENKAINEFCNAHGYKKGRWLRLVAKQAMSRPSGAGDGSQQARDMAETIGRLA